MLSDDRDRSDVTSLFRSRSRGRCRPRPLKNTLSKLGLFEDIGRLEKVSFVDVVFRGHTDYGLNRQRVGRLDASFSER